MCMKDTKPNKTLQALLGIAGLRFISKVKEKNAPQNPQIYNVRVPA